MIIFNTIHKKKSAIITALILIALVWIVSNTGMKYLTPPLEYGIRVNFGTANFESKESSAVEEKKMVNKRVPCFHSLCSAPSACFIIKQYTNTLLCSALKRN